MLMTDLFPPSHISCEAETGIEHIADDRSMMAKVRFIDTGTIGFLVSQPTKLINYSKYNNTVELAGMLYFAKNFHRRYTQPQPLTD